MAALVDLDDQAGEFPLGLAAVAVDGALDVTLSAVRRSADVDLQPPGVAAALLQVPSHGTSLWLRPVGIANGLPRGVRSVKGQRDPRGASRCSGHQPDDQGILARSEGIEPPTF